MSLSAESHRRPTPATDRLSRREREIMNAVFALGKRAFAEDIRDRLAQQMLRASIGGQTSKSRT